MSYTRTSQCWGRYNAFYTGQGKTNVLIMAFKSPWNQFGKGKESNLSYGKITRIDGDG